MTFIWPGLLWLLAALPVVVAAYVWLLRRRKKAVARYANLTMVKEALGAGPRFRRHVPPILFLVALALMVTAEFQLLPRERPPVHYLRLGDR